MSSRPKSTSPAFGRLSETPSNCLARARIKPVHPHLADRPWQSFTRDRAFHRQRVGSRAARFMRLEDLWLDRLPEMIRFFHSHPRATVVAHLGTTWRVQVRERNCEPAILDLINEDVQQDRGSGVAELDMWIADHHEVLREIQRQLIVGAAELGMNDPRTEHVGSA